MEYFNFIERRKLSIVTWRKEILFLILCILTIVALYHYQPAFLVDQLEEWFPGAMEKFSLSS